MALATTQAPTSDDATRVRVLEHMSDPRWRWQHLYWIKDKDGKHVQFTLRPAIEQFIADMHTRNVILKARQHGFSTFILIYFLDTMLFTPGTEAVLLAHRKQAAKKLFDSKIAYPYNHMPEMLRMAKPVIEHGVERTKCTTVESIQFANGSSLLTEVSARSGTFQLLHLSEYGPLCTDSPQKADEVKGGSLATAHERALVFIESTAKGAIGDFYDRCKDGRSLTTDRREAHKPLSKLEYKFHFFGWWINPEYRERTGYVEETDRDKEYFEKVENTMGIKLDPEQRSWYIITKRSFKGNMKSEYPSTPDEAFEASIQGAYYGERMELLAERGQICRVPHLPGSMVHTAWDIGYTTAVWFFQKLGPAIHLIRYHEAQGLGMDGWRDVLDKFKDQEGYHYGQHFAPFDVTTQNGVKIISGQGILDAAEQAGIHFEQLPLEISVTGQGIPRTRDTLPLCYFDRANCERGLWCLRTYHEEVNASLSTDDNPVYTGRPAKGPESHGADAFRYLTMAMPELRSNDTYTKAREESRQLQAFYRRPQ